MILSLNKLQDADELFTALSRIDTSVPGRIDGRTTQQTETWTICRLLSTLAKAGQLRFPLSVTHRDRPDFLIKTGSDEIGVEVTEAITTQYAAYCALAEREFPDAYLEPANFRWGAPTLTVRQMRELLRQNRLTSDGWAGDSPEQEWASCIQSAVDTKLAKLEKPAYQKFEKNWLAIYDNMPLPNIHLARAIAILRPQIESYWTRSPGFDEIFVERGPVIARITPRDSQHVILNDLW